MDRDEILEAVRLVDEHLDDHAPVGFRGNRLASLWRRVTKVCEESGEVWRALSRCTGENPRIGEAGTIGDVLCELADTAFAALLGIQHVTKDTISTWAYLEAAARKAEGRATGHGQ